MQLSRAFTTLHIILIKLANILTYPYMYKHEHICPKHFKSTFIYHTTNIQTNYLLRNYIVVNANTSKFSLKCFISYLLHFLKYNYSTNSYLCNRYSYAINSRRIVHMYVQKHQDTICPSSSRTICYAHDKTAEYSSLRLQHGLQDWPLFSSIWIYLGQTTNIKLYTISIRIITFHTNINIWYLTIQNVHPYFTLHLHSTNVIIYKWCLEDDIVPQCVNSTNYNNEITFM